MIAALGCVIGFTGQSVGRTQEARLPGAHHIPVAAGLVRLFGGVQEDIGEHWEHAGKPAAWTFDNGIMVANSTGTINTRDRYTDFQLHVEFRVPDMPDKKGQAKGNSGVFLQGRYEIQILDSFGIREPGTGDCGAVYNQSAPLVNACLPPMQWQTYDIAFRAPRFDPTTHEMTEPARVTVFQNGIIIQNDQVIKGPTHVVKSATPTNNAVGTKTKPAAAASITAPAIDKLDEPGPITLQWHGNAVAFRNIWILPMPLQGATHYEPR